METDVAFLLCHLKAKIAVVCQAWSQRPLPKPPVHYIWAGGINCIRLRASLPSKPVVSLLFPSFIESAHLFLTPEAPNTRPLAQFNLKSSTGLVLYEGYLTYWDISYAGSSNQSFQHPKTSSLLWIRRNKTVRTHSWLPFLVRGNIIFSQQKNAVINTKWNITYYMLLFYIKKISHYIFM